MLIGAMPFCQNLNTGLEDGAFIRREARLAILAEELGFDFVGWPEHHFDRYSMSPDNFVTLSYVAARTSSIRLAPAVCILPWNDPVRVAEKVVLLDELSDGRLMFGMGRGLSPLEYGGFRVEMGEARPRWDEAAAMILRALETGVAEGDGPFYPQPRVELRPAPNPQGNYRERAFAVANSVGSAVATAKLGVPMMFFSRNPVAEHLPQIDAYREAFEAEHGRPAPGPMISDLTFCSAGPDPDLDRIVRRCWLVAEEAANNHYALNSTDFSKIKGYEAYAQRQGNLVEQSPEEAAQKVWDAQANGTPEEIVETWRSRLDAVGGTATALFVFDWGGLPTEVVENSMRLFAKEVLPELQRLGAPAPATV
jgi:alkanesulfonate monooxygenase SsuD/methylene tetrahydromethanopterin reductase-like flavin-dependent oxidoreductase (luciferase family)